jgi:repressor LexA
MPDKLDVLQYIKNYMNDNGWAPSVREIGASIGASSTGTANYFLVQLEDDGFIFREPHTARAIRITSDGNAALYQRTRGGSGVGS